MHLQHSSCVFSASGHLSMACQFDAAGYVECNFCLSCITMAASLSLVLLCLTFLFVFWWLLHTDSVAAIYQKATCDNLGFCE